MVADIENTMQKVFSTFADMLKGRKDVNLINEKTIVALLFNAAVKEKVPPHDITLEVSHSALKKKQSYDMRLCTSGNKKIAIECKYHKEVQGLLSILAGKVFEDLRRLSKIKQSQQKSVDCYFVYVTTQAMATHFSNNYENFFELEEGNSAKINKDFYSSLASRVSRQNKSPSTCQKQISGAFTCTITNVFANEFGKEKKKIYIRIFKVGI